MLNELLERMCDEVCLLCRDGVGGGGELTKMKILNAVDLLIKAEREACAKVCEERTEKCATKADVTDDEDDRTELKANAWQFSVLAAEIRMRSNSANHRKAEERSDEDCPRELALLDLLF